MPVIKTVTNGDRSVQFKAVSLGHAAAIAFGLCSIIGAQQTWLWAESHERSIIVTTIRTEILDEIGTHAKFEEKRCDQMDRRIEALERDLDAALRQININTGKIESGEGRR